ncbi:MAG: helix-turn-helix transcriptional regulator [Desulfosudis oleivorans]|nr:helix-turn-helix transcriptional regulator [Desulfosudis oleivorans]
MSSRKTGRRSEDARVHPALRGKRPDRDGPQPHSHPHQQDGGADALPAAGGRPREKAPDVLQVRFSAAGVSVASLTALALREGTSLRLPDDSEILLRDGTSRHINCVITPVKQEDNRITGLVVTFQCVDRGEDPAAQKPTTLTAAIGDFGCADGLRLIGHSQGAHLYRGKHREAHFLDELAGLSYMSRFHFSRTFKARTGMTPMSLIAHVRIERSMSLLRQNPDCVSDIALAVGFSSLSHFTDQFKRITGMTPVEYRKSLKNSRPAAAAPFPSP